MVCARHHGNRPLLVLLGGDDLSVTDLRSVIAPSVGPGYDRHAARYDHDTGHFNDFREPATPTAEAAAERLGLEPGGPVPRGRSMRATAAVQTCPSRAQPIPICPVSESHPIPLEPRRRRDQLVPMRTTAKLNHTSSGADTPRVSGFPGWALQTTGGLPGLGSWMAAPACLIACLAALLILIARLKLCADEDRADVMPHRPR